MPQVSLAAQTLPEFLPHTPPATVRPIWIPWPLALLLAPLFWLMPKRLGPHFAAASWTAAIVAHLAWGAYGAASAILAIVAPQYTLASWLLGRTPEQLGLSLAPVPTLEEILRGPLALLVSAPAQMQLMGVVPPGIMTVSPLVLVPIELVLLALASLLMPFIAAGEPSRRLLGRSLKLALWASTSLIVLALAIQGLLVRDEGVLEHWPVRVTLTLYSIWAISLILRGGSRYAGPAEGPAWQPHEPLCIDCGYGLTGLSLASNCPECGRPVADSLPDRRRPSPFAAAASLSARIRAFPRTYWLALRGKGFYDCLATRDALPPARRFAVLTCCLSAAALLALHILAWNLHNYFAGQPPFVTRNRFPKIVLLTLLLVGLIGVAALAASGFGRREIQKRAIATFYWSVWLLPLGISLIVPIVPIVWVVETPFFRTHYVHVPQIGQIDLYAAFVCLILVIPVSVLWRALVHLARAVRGVRYAND